MSSPLNLILSDEYLRSVLLTIHQQVVKRIFEDGQDASGNQIGTYSLGYIRTRERKGLGGDDKVILEFTGQMRNDFLLVEDRGRYGSGFNNSANFDKSKWVEETYDKEIFNLTIDEQDLLIDILNKKLYDTLN